MCRLAFFNEQWLDDCSTDGLASYFTYLERRQGGSGNGVAGYKRGRGVRVYKGIRTTSQALAETVMRWRDGGYTQFIFHTRMATSGNVADINCQPFSFSRYGAFAHNGHNYEYHSHDSPVSDSYLMALALHLEDITIPQLRKCRGTFVGWQHGYPFAVSDGLHDIQLDIDEDMGAWCIASDIPSGMRQGDFYDAGKYLWIGQRFRTSHGMIDTLPDVPTTRASGHYYDDWGDYNYGRAATVYTPKATTQGTLSAQNGATGTASYAETSFRSYYNDLSPEEQADWDEWIEQEEQEWARQRLAAAKKEGTI